MAIIKTVEGKTPRWGKNCFIAENAVLTGDCILGDDCSIWYSAVLRSDVDAIRCGNRVNVQDCACIHQTGTMPCILEDDVSVGHGAIVHGATVRKGALIGINATVLDKADIGEGVIIAAGAVITMFTDDWYKVAMGNAIPELKAKADFITDNVDADGIYNACQKLGLFLD